MKIVKMTIIAFVLAGFAVNAQIVSNEDFEKLKTSEDIMSWQKGHFAAWGKCEWTLSEEDGDGYDASNKYASSDGAENANLLKYLTLEAGETYEFSVAVKMTGTNGDNWKGNYTVNVMSSSEKGKKPHNYISEKIEEPKEGVWKMHKVTFKVKKKKEKVSVQVTRWKSDVTLNIDNFEVKKI